MTTPNAGGDRPQETSGAGLFSVLTLCAAHTTALRALETVMPRGRAAATLTVLYAAGSAGPAVAGYDRLRAAGLVSERALEQLREGLPASGAQRD